MRTLTVLGLLAAVWGALRTEGFSVQGPREPLVARPGDEVLLPCSVDSAVPLQELEVEWMRTDPDTLVHLFFEGESRPESQHQSYRGRAELFPQEIPRGNFSLRLANVTAEDTGVYRCAVHTAQGSGETTVELKEQERLAVSGASEPVAAYAGGEVVLNCSVDTNVPLQELEVQWMRTDSEVLVLLFSEGESRPESQHQRYRGRAELFPQEIPRGNFSLRLKDIRTEDKGKYMCRVHTDSGSANTTAELKQLGFSTAHIWILLLALSALTVVLLTSVPTCLFLLQKRETRRWCHCYLVNCYVPGLFLFTAFILWAITEGFLWEPIICATVNVLRILLVLMMAPSSKGFPDCLYKLSKRFPVILVVNITFCIVMAVEFGTTHAQSTAEQRLTVLAYTGSVMFSLYGFFVKGTASNVLEKVFCGFIDLAVFLYFLILFMSFTEKFIIGCASGACVAIFFLNVNIFWQKYTFLKVVSVIFYILLFIMSILLLNKILRNEEGVSGFICEVIFLWTLSVAEVFTHDRNIPDGDTRILLFLMLDSEIGNGVTVIRTPTALQFRHLQIILYVFGTSCLAIVNSIALISAVSENDSSLVKDIRLVVLPFESLFVICWIGLQIYAFYLEQVNAELETNESPGQGKKSTKPLLLFKLQRTSQRNQGETEL